jgi:Ca-activated chloride channel homolog
MEFQAPWAFLLLLLLPVLGTLQFKTKKSAAVRFSSLTHLKRTPSSLRLRLRPILVVLRLICLACLIIALTRPRKGTVLSEISTEGVAIEAVVDRSGSMQAEMDFDGEKLDRLEVVKRVLGDFIKGDKKKLEGRGGDLIGLVTFARYAETICPLVLSHDVLLEFLRQAQIVTLRAEDGTAIGDAIALAAARLKKAEEEILKRRQQLGLADDEKTEEPVPEAFKIKSKAIILLTDGRNNVGEYDPLSAAALAQEWGIKIYTIGIGSGQSFRTINTFMGQMKMPTHDDLDEDLLKAIAEKTGAFYSRADDVPSLRKIVQRINDMEKSEVKMIQYTTYTECFGYFALPALILLVLEIIGHCTLFRKIP